VCRPQGESRRHQVLRCNLHLFSPDAAEPIRRRIFRDSCVSTRGPGGLPRSEDQRSGGRERGGDHVMQYDARKEPVIRALYDRELRTAGLL